jgi:hypothetical protein
MLGLIVGDIVVIVGKRDVCKVGIAEVAVGFCVGLGNDTTNGELVV